MKKMLKIFIGLVILFLISIVLFMTGKRHDILIENNGTAEIKYSINGEPYKTLNAKKKGQAISKGINNIIYLKTVDGKVIEKDLPAEDITILVNEVVNNSVKWYKKIGE